MGPGTHHLEEIALLAEQKRWGTFFDKPPNPMTTTDLPKETSASTDRNQDFDLP